MRVMQIIGGIDIAGGGPQNALLLLNQYLNKKGINSIIFTTNAGYKKNLQVPLKRLIFYKKNKIVFYPYPENFVLRKMKKLYYSGIYGIEFFLGIKRNLKNYDIVHIHGVFSFIDMFSSHFCIREKKPYLISPRGAFSPELVRKRSRYLKNIYLKYFGKNIIRYSAGIHCLTEVEKNDIESLNLNLTSIFIIPNGLEIEKFEREENNIVFNKFPFLKNKKYILFLSRINWKKGLDILIPAFYEISKNFKDIYLVITGPDNEGYGKKVKKWVKNYGIMEKVIFTGPLYGDEKISILKNAIFFVLPSYSENFGMAVVEAMACGTPVLISDKVGIYKEIEEYNAGIITQTDVESFYRGMKNLLENEDLRKKISQNAKRLVRDYYDINKVVERMIEVYEKVLHL